MFGGGEGSLAGWEAKGRRKCRELNVTSELKRRQRLAAWWSTSSERRDLRAERRDRRAQSVTICELKVAIGELKASR